MNSVKGMGDKRDLDGGGTIRRSERDKPPVSVLRVCAWTQLNQRGCVCVCVCARECDVCTRRPCMPICCCCLFSFVRSNSVCSVGSTSGDILEDEKTRSPASLAGRHPVTTKYTNDRAAVRRSHGVVHALADPQTVESTLWNSLSCSY